jgi:hypothetical protein
VVEKFEFEAKCIEDMPHVLAAKSNTLSAKGYRILSANHMLGGYLV